MQYGPLLAACIALAGVMATLIVTGRRAERDSRLRREDDYRSATRTAVVSVLTAAGVYRREAWSYSDPLTLIALGFEGASQLRDSTDAAIRQMNEALEAAHLLALDARLQETLQHLTVQFENTAHVLHEAMSAFWDGRIPGPAWRQRGQTFRAFDESKDALRRTATLVLAPTVRSRSVE